MYLVFSYNYKPSDNFHSSRSVRSPFNDLKAGLEETLSVWYPTAGRLTLNPTDGKLDVLCNNAGAVLVEADTKAKISDIGDLSQYNKFYESLVFKPGFNGNFSESPMVIGQVTKFGCGGSAIGIGASHSLFDGRSMFNFLTAWSSKTTMKEVEGVEPHEPVHMRGRLLVGRRRTQHLITNSCGNMSTSAVKVSAFDHLHQLIKQGASDGSLDLDGKLGGCKFSEMGCSNQENHILKTFRDRIVEEECFWIEKPYSHTLIPRLRWLQHTSGRLHISCEGYTHPDAISTVFDPYQARYQAQGQAS